MKNTPRIAEMTDAEISYETERPIDSDINQPLTEGEQQLLKDIADLDSEVDEEFNLFGDWQEELGPRRQMLMNAADLVDGDRNAQYGDPRQDFRRTAKYWNAHIHGVIDRKLAENDGQFQTEEILGIEDVAIMMSLLKISRLAWAPGKEDTWTDLAGYAACGWHCVAPEETPHTHEGHSH